MHNSDEIKLFSSRAENGLCSHAYIVDGDAGVGKLDFALHCARIMLCNNKIKPCDVCESCKKALSDNHPDIYIIGKEKTATISDVRELIRRSTLKPNDGDKQIFIVCNAGKLREEAQNALLKLFEEPPESVAIFLLTESRSSLLPTVLSRGQRIHLDGMRDIEIAQAIYEKYSTVSKTELENALSLANGNLGVAEKYLSKESVALRGKAEKLLIAVLSKNQYELSSLLLAPVIATSSKVKRQNLVELLSEFVNLTAEAAKSKYGTSNIAPKDGECARLISKASKKALIYINEMAFRSMTSMENSANLKAAVTKLTIDLFKAADL